jgi:hypothetical protein
MTENMIFQNGGHFKNGGHFQNGVHYFSTCCISVNFMLLVKEEFRKRKDDFCLGLNWRYQ